MVWDEFGCPGHGKGLWDGLGTMTKSGWWKMFTLHERCDFERYHLRYREMLFQKVGEQHDDIP